MIVTAVIGLSYMPNVLSSHGSGLSYLGVKQLIHAVVICKSNITRLLMQGLKFTFSCWKKALSEIKGSLAFFQQSVQLYFVFILVCVCNWGISLNFSVSSSVSFGRMPVFKGKK